MNKTQKISLFNLIAASVGLLLTVAYLIPGTAGLPRFLTSCAALIVCSFILAARVCLIIIQKEGERHYDERDKLIAQRATFVGFVTLFFVIFSACLISFLIVGPGGSISIGSVLNIFLMGALSLFFAESLAIQIQYGWGAKEKNRE